MLGKNGLLKIMNKKIDEIALNMEKFNLVDYAQLLEHPKKLLYLNFIGGLSRGIGMAIGFTLLGAVIIYLLQAIVRWKLPVIGQFISEIVKIVQENTNKAR